ncbi:hypothetical protein [Corynebacterium frankenforstense]|nr:hypothetical protein [Corynebacterium frankenforstense]
MTTPAAGHRRRAGRLPRPDVAELRHLVAEVEDALQRATRGW